MRYTCKTPVDNAKYCHATLYCLAELQRSGIQPTTMLADYIEDRHVRGLPTGFSQCKTAHKVINGKLFTQNKSLAKAVDNNDDDGEGEGRSTADCEKGAINTRITTETEAPETAKRYGAYLQNKPSTL